ncbi:MAG: PAS domain-containing protein [Verrucomicrobia bacterium]|nr:PAS domain-containing protein [Verrucomicrobiota bacterium]
MLTQPPRPPMNRPPNTSVTAAELRRRAEARLRQRPGNQKAEGRRQRAEADPQRLLHELQVHQVELEMQNAELQEARNRLETLLEKYTDLYDFAPVGYFSLDEQGRILEVNLTAAALLGVERSQLIHRRLPRFVSPASQPIFLAFLEHVFAGSGHQVCEARLLKGDGAAFWANLHGTSALAVSGPHHWCRVAVSDITTLREAEEAQRRMEALAMKNRELRQEIVRRQAVEAALKKSERHQIQLLAQSRHMQDQLRQLSRQMLQAQEEERKRISRELHDEIAQTLVGINVHLENLARRPTVNRQGLKRGIARTQRLVEKSVDIVHRFARELRPTLLDDLGLIASLHSFMKDFTKRTGIRVHFTTFAGVEQLNSAKRTVLYRVVQSALANVARHARASRVDVSLRKLPRAVRLEIQDNGKSFEVQRVLHATHNKHLGLLGMRERVEMVGGSFVVESTPDQGTIIRAHIPSGNGGRD